MFNESLTLKSSNELNTKPPDKDEILAVLKGLHNKKAANDIPPSFIKCAAESNEFMKKIDKRYKMVWATKKIPEKWGLLNWWLYGKEHRREKLLIRRLIEHCKLDRLCAKY